jgi:phosphate-selective porin
VRLWDGKSSGLGGSVNILVLDGTIERISADPIPPVADTMQVDGDGRIVIGIIEQGAQANFLLLDGSPIEDITILAEAPSHTALLMQDGSIVKNTLVGTTVAPSTPVEEIVTQDTPEAPVPTVPGAWKRFDTKWVQFEPIGALVMDFVRFGQGDTSRDQVGDLEEFEVPDIRVLRAGAAGVVKFKKPWRWFISGAYGGFLAGFERGVTPTWQLFDLSVEIPVSGLGFVTAGKTKEPFSMERMMGGGFMPLPERSMGTDAMTPARNTGVFVRNAFADKRMNWAGGWFNNTSESTGRGGNQYIGRLAGLPLDDPDGKGLLHIGLAGRYSTAPILEFRIGPEQATAPDFVDTGEFDADGTTYLLAEVYYTRKSFLFASQYLSNWTRAPQYGDPVFRSFFAQATWTLTGESRPYDRDRGIFGTMFPKSKVFDGGTGIIEVGARYSAVDLQNARILGGELSRISGTANWYLNWNALLNFNYGLARLYRTDSVGYTHIVQARFGLYF